MTERKLDPTEAHRHFSVGCFNAAWDLMDKVDRTPQEEEEMLQRSIASLWHWAQRDDCTAQNLSIGYWQVARIQALLGRADEARRYGQLCLEASVGDEIAPFAKAYAYEALARAEAVAGDTVKRDKYVSEVQAVLRGITDEETRKMLLDDLATIP